MSRAPSDLQRGISSASADGEPLGSDGSIHNPLAGARPVHRRRRWLRRLFLLALYAGIVAVIVSQGSRFWQNHPIVSGFLPDFLVQSTGPESQSEPPPVSRRVQQEPAVRIEPDSPAAIAPEPPQPPVAERSAEPASPVEPEPAPDAPVAVTPEAQPDNSAPRTNGSGDDTASDDTNQPSNATTESEPSPAASADRNTRPEPESNGGSREATEQISLPTTEPVSETSGQPQGQTGQQSEGPEESDNGGSPGSAQSPVSTNQNPQTRQVLFSESGRNQRMEEARNWFREGQQERALEHLAEWLREDDHTEVRQLYGRLLLRADRPQEARRVLRPQANTAEMELRAYADYQSGAYADAVRYYTRLLNEAPTVQTEWYLWLGIGSEQMQNPNEAIRYYRLYLREGQQQSTQLREYAQDRLRQLDR